MEISEKHRCSFLFVLPNGGCISSLHILSSPASASNKFRHQIFLFAFASSVRSADEEKRKTDIKKPQNWCYFKANSLQPLFDENSERENTTSGNSLNTKLLWQNIWDFRHNLLAFKVIQLLLPFFKENYLGNLAISCQQEIRF